MKKNTHQTKPSLPPPPPPDVKSDALALVADDARGLSLTEACAALHAHAAAARYHLNGRELTLFESDPERIDRLVALVSVGNYVETASRICGISSRSIRGWLEKFEAGDPRYAAIGTVLRGAEAIAEADAVRDVRVAGRNPNLWASAMTFLERRHPDKWGRRLDAASNQPQLVVHVGGLTSADVQIGIVVPPGPSPPAIGDTGK